MKTYLKLSLTTLFALLLFAGAQAQKTGIQFFHGTLAEAQQEAAESNKLIFVDAYATWCGPCIHMAKNFFTLEEVGDFYNENFINVKMDMEKGEGPGLSQVWDIRAYPTLLFLDAEGNVIRKEVGMKLPDELVALGKTALLPSSEQPEQVEEPIQGEVIDLTIEALEKSIENEDREAFDQIIAELMASEDEDKYFLYIEAQTYWEEVHGDISAYMPKLVKFIEEEAPQDPRLVLIAAAYIDQYAKDDELIVLARHWTGELLKELPYFYTYQFYASLQNRLGETELAIEAQKVAIRMAKEEGVEISELEQELKEMEASL